MVFGRFVDYQLAKYDLRQKALKSNRRAIMRKLLPLLLITLFVAPAYSFDYVMGPVKHNVPSSFPSKPARGVPYTDPVFHTTIIRITDAATDDDPASRYVISSYAKWNPENSDGTRAILQANINGTALYNVDKNSPQKYTFVKFLTAPPFGGGTISGREPRWDATDPHKFYFVYGMRFYSYTIVEGGTDYTTLVRDFSSDYPNGDRIYMDEEGNPSDDRRYWVWTVDEFGHKNRAFSYDKATNTIIGNLDPTAFNAICGPPDPYTNWVSFTPNGNKIIIGGVDDDGKAGLLSYNKDFTNKVDLQGWQQHSDAGIDFNGNDVLVGIDMFLQGYIFVDLSTGTHNCMNRRPWPDTLNESGMEGNHTTASTFAVAKPGWALFSTDRVGSTGDCNTTGDHFDCQLIFLMEIKDTGCVSDPNINITNPARVWQIAHHNTGSGGYNNCAHATMNKAGTRIYFKSSWNDPTTPINDCTVDHPCETYIVELPSTWYKDLAGAVPYTIGLPSAPPAGRTFITSYAFNDGNATTIASKYGIIITKSDKAPAVTTMKSTNASMKAFYYKDVLTHGSTYYVLDAVSGKKIVHKDWGWYLMDISNPSYVNDIKTDISSTLNANTQFDGVFLDDVKLSLDATEYYQEGTTTNPTFLYGLVTNWQTNMNTLLSAIKTQIGSKLAIINSSPWAGSTSPNYLSRVDGLYDEAYGHANWDNASTFLSTDSWKYHLDMMISTINNFKYYLAQSGVADGAKEAEINKLVKYCFASFMLGVSGSGYGKHYFTPSLTYSNYYWYTDWGLNIGTPIGAYSQINGKSSYRRDFTNGIVIVNPTDSGETVSLGGNYRDENGNTLSSITLSAREGAILFTTALDTVAPAPPKGLRVTN